MRRRDLLKVGALAATATSSVADESNCPVTETAGTFVLVHGANQGGWCWRYLATELRARNYRVYTPTLTGLGERHHLLSPEISLQTHIDDIVNVIESEELQDIVLVGHSYGGTVVTGVCDRLRERITEVVFLDANTPNNGEATIPGLNAAIVEKATGEPMQDGYLVPPMDPASLGIEPDDLNYAWLQRRMTAQPIDTLTEPLILTNNGTAGMRRSFVLTTPKEKLRPFALKRLEEIETDASWNYTELLVGHEAMVSAPCEVASLLIELIQADT